MRAALTPLGRVLGHAARRGLIGGNPMRRLEQDNDPRRPARQQRILDREAIGRLLEAAGDVERPLRATAVF